MVGRRRGRWSYLYFARVPRVLGGEWTVRGKLAMGKQEGSRCSH